MFIFLRLLLAHMIGDFPLQFDRIYKLKEKGLAGIVPHILIVLGCMLLMAGPYLDRPAMWVFLGFIGVTHLLQDRLKIRFSAKAKREFFPYLIDQAFHVGFIALVFLTPLRDFPPVANGSVLAMAYNSDHIVLFFIILIAASFNGYFMITLFKKDFLLKTSDHSSFEKCYGMIERSILVCAVMSGGLVLGVTLCLAVLIRITAERFGKKYLSVSKDFAEKNEILLTCLIGLLFGGLFKVLVA